MILLAVILYDICAICVVGLTLLFARLGWYGGLAIMSGVSLVAMTAMGIVLARWDSED